MEKRAGRFEKSAWLLALSVLLWAAGCRSLPPHDPFALGLSPDGFEQAGPPEVYNRETLFDYIDGEADLYLPLGFRLLCAQTFRSRRSGALMVMDAYQMGRAEGAERIFERFTRETGSKVRGMGDAAWTDKHIVLFRQDRYFIRISPDPSPDSAAKPNLEDLLELARSAGRALRRR